MGPAPAVAAIRLAVRLSLQQYDDARPVFVACSGGADSTALASAVAFEAARASRRAGLITVDHGLQAGSGEQARRVAALGYELGLTPVHQVTVSVGTTGGPEAAARTARYAAFERLCVAEPDALIVLGHTADDQAETVLLGLGRGSGPRSIAGMRGRRDAYLRPLLGVRRSETVRACAELGLDVFHDPHNEDARYRRVRLRTEVLPLLDDVLGGGVADALARTAAQLHDDLDALDGLAGELSSRAQVPGPGGAVELDCAVLAGQPMALLTRVLKAWAEASPASGSLTAVHVWQLAQLIQAWHGQGPLCLPGGTQVRRRSGRLSMSSGE